MPDTDLTILPSILLFEEANDQLWFTFELRHNPFPNVVVSTVCVRIGLVSTGSDDHRRWCCSDTKTRGHHAASQVGQDPQNLVLLDAHSAWENNRNPIFEPSTGQCIKSCVTVREQKATDQFFTSGAAE